MVSAAVGGVTSAPPPPIVTVGANVPCGAPWLTATGPTSGALSTDQNGSLNVLIDATGLAPGDYAAYLCVSTDGTSKPLFNQGTENLLIPVRITVIDDSLFKDGFDSGE